MHLRSRGQEDPYYWPDLLNAETISLEFALMKHERPSFWSVQLSFPVHFTHFFLHYLFLLSFTVYIRLFGLMYLLLHLLVEDIHRRAHVYIGS
jgi:hypothetical protein